MNTDNARVPRSTAWALGTIACLSAVAVDSSIPAIPAVIDHLGITLAEGQRVISVYLLGFALGQIPIGILSDRLGRLPVLLIGLTAYFLATLATLFVSNIFDLSVARFCQGLAGASGSVLSRSMARDLVSGRELAKLNTMMVICLGLAMIFAPIAGSAFVQWLGWFGGFVPGLLIATLAAVMLKLCLRETLVAKSKDVSILRQIMTSGGLFFRCAPALWGSLIIAFSFFGYMGLLSGFGHVLVQHYGVVGASVGPLFSAAAIFYVAAALVSLRMLNRMQPMDLIKIGLWGYGLSLVLALAVIYLFPNSALMFWLSMIPFFAGLGVVFPSTMAIAMAPFSRGAGLAASIMGSLQMLFSAMGAATTGWLDDGTSTGMMQVMILGIVLSVCVFLSGLLPTRLRTELFKT
ncbi:MAG: MFS transporter [Pseudomonadota bacterium]